MLRAVLPTRSVYFSFAKVTILSSAAIFAGCQRIPDQSRVTKMDFSDIVRNVRCEFQEALAPIYPRGHWIYETGVAYQFIFTSTINNNADFGFTGNWPFFENTPFTNNRSNGNLNGVISADIDKTREGITDLKITETLENIMKSDCSSSEYFRSYKYPIKGRIGVDPLIEKYYRSTSIRGITSITDISQTIDFTVKKTGGFDPTLFLSPLPLPARTFNFPLKFSADRSDQHKVVITFVPPPLWKVAGHPKDPNPKTEKIIKVQLVGSDRDTPPQMQLVGPTQIQIVQPKPPETKTEAPDGKKFAPDGQTLPPKIESVPYTEGRRGGSPDRTQQDRARELEQNLRRLESLSNDRRILEQLNRLD